MFLKADWQITVTRFPLCSDNFSFLCVVLRYVIVLLLRRFQPYFCLSFLHIFCTDPLYRQLDEKITRTVDKVEELKQELKSQRKKEG